MANQGFGVRLFEIEADGALEPILGVDEDYFAGTVPNVGDTVAMWGLHDVYRFYSVQRRYFIDSPDADNGWCIIVRQVESSSQFENVIKAWTADTKFWREVEAQEAAEERARLNALIQNLKGKGSKPKPPVVEESPAESLKAWQHNQAERDKHRPHHNLTAPAERALRFMMEHPEAVTADLIPRVGDKTLEVMAKAGVVKPGGKDHRGQREWFITDEGRAEIERTDTWRNWKFE